MTRLSFLNVCAAHPQKTAMRTLTPTTIPDYQVDPDAIAVGKQGRCGNDNRHRSDPGAAIGTLGLNTAWCVLLAALYSLAAMPALADDAIQTPEPRPER